MQGVGRVNKDLKNICNWFVDDKLSIHIGKDNTKSILFAVKRRSTNVCQLNIRYRLINIKQYSQVTYFGVHVRQDNIR